MYRYGYGPWLTVFSVLGLSLGAGAQARAQVGISARTAGMAGAGVAVARGGEGLFYNPAALPNCEAAELGLSASAYGFQTRTFQDYFLISDTQGNTESADLSVKSISAFPSAASSVYPFELAELPAALGFGVFIPAGAALESAVLFDPDIYPLAREGVIEDTRTEYWLNAAGAMKFGALSLGLGGVVQVTQIKQLFSLSYFEVGPSPTSPFVDSNLESVEAIAVDFRGQLGLQLDLGTFRLGLNVLSPTANVGGSAKYRSSRVFSDAIQGTDISTIIIEHAGSENFKPLEFALGGALVLPGLLVTAEGAVRLSRTYNEVTFDGQEGQGNISEPLSLRLALAAAVEVSPSVEVRAGIFAVPLAQKLPTEDELSIINGSLQKLNDLEGAAQNAVIEQVFAAAGSTDIREYGASVGMSFTRGGGRADVALTGVLITGNHITIGDRVLDSGDIESSLNKRSISGFAMYVSVGGTYGFSDDKGPGVLP